MIFIAIFVIFLLIVLILTITKEKNNGGKPIKPLHIEKPNNTTNDLNDDDKGNCQNGVCSIDNRYNKNDLCCVTKWIREKNIYKDDYDIYISDLQSVNRNNISKYKIKAIINLSCMEYEPLTAEHLNIPVYDHEMVDISKHFDEAYKFIDKNIKNGNVLIHCQAGISRSATIIISYLMKKYHLSYGDIIKNIRCARPIINPNSGFTEQLLKMQSNLGIVE